MMMMIAGQLDGMLTHVGIDPLVRVKVSGRRSRREYRGNKNKVELTQDLVYKWIPTFESMVLSRCNATCERVFDTYESAVGQYGYSLRNLKRVVPTPLLREYLLPV